MIGIHASLKLVHDGRHRHAQARWVHFRLVVVRSHFNAQTASQHLRNEAIQYGRVIDVLRYLKFQKAARSLSEFTKSA